MEISKLKGLLKGASSKHNDLKLYGKSVNFNSNNSHQNNNHNEVSSIETLEEIRPETTAEGYGLRTPYGTHLNLDFVKYCEDLSTTQNFKRTSSLRKSRQRAASSSVSQNRQQTHHQIQQQNHGRLAGGPSSESLDSLASDGFPDMGRTNARAENTLMETRRRLEAFRSFRTKRNKSAENGASAPPITSYNNGKMGYSSYNQRKGSTSPASSSSGSMTPNSIGNILNGNNVTPQHLQIVREQMSNALTRLRELEEQVKSIPALQVKISVLQQEKKHLVEELKLAENKPLSPRKTNSSDFISSKSTPYLRQTASLTSSSGVSSASHSLVASPVAVPDAHSPITPPFTSSNNGVSHPQFANTLSPPSPPKRKYRSQGVGDTTSLWNVVCYSKDDKKNLNVGTTCDLLPTRKISVDFSSIVDSLDIDAAFDIFPPPPKQYMDRCTCTDVSVRNTSSQTKIIQNSSISTQTHKRTQKHVGCGEAALSLMCDRSCETIRVSLRDVAAMTSPSLVATNDQSTSCLNLIHTREIGIGDPISMTCTGTSTEKQAAVAMGTSCEDLIQYENKSVGLDYLITMINSATSTDLVGVSNAEVECNLLVREGVDKGAMTETALGKWCSYSDQRSVSSGGENEITNLKTVCINTESIKTENVYVETEKIMLKTQSTFADIRMPTAQTGTNTSSIEMTERATDCSDIFPIFTQIFAEKPKISSQNMNSNRVAEVPSSVDPSVVIVVSKVDACTDTYDLEKPKQRTSEEIDTYVDKVQHLLEEQQSLLAENYEVFTDEWDGNNSNANKVSRFVNPIFEATDNYSNKADEKPIISTAITASFSLLSNEAGRESDSSEEDYSSEEERFSPLRPLPSPDLDLELKSIMKKPGTPVREKKFLRFAEGVKSDESSSDDDSSSSEESEDEIEDKLKEEAKMQEEYLVDKTKQKKEKEKTDIIKETTKTTYSEEFVKTVEKTEDSKVEITNGKEVLLEADILHDLVARSNIVNSNQEHRTKYIFTTEVLDACDVIEKQLRNPKSVDKTLLAQSTSTVQREWFQVAAQSDSPRSHLDDFISDLADTSLPVLRKVVNMTDSSGNTVLHYAISHGNISIVEGLLGIDELDVDKVNQAGYSVAMLAALCDIKTNVEKKLFHLLFSKSDINAHAKEAGQTALMLAVSHGRLNTAQLLLDCGADANACDQDGSTSLMCAVEHGQIEGVKMLLAQSNCDATLADTDGSTALSIAMEAGHRDIAILLYAQLNFKPNARSPRPRATSKSMIPSPIRKKVKS